MLKFSLISILQCLIINMSNKLQTQALRARKKAKSNLSGFPKADEESEISVVWHFYFLSVLESLAVLRHVLLDCLGVRSSVLLDLSSLQYRVAQLAVRKKMQ